MDSSEVKAAVIIILAGLLLGSCLCGGCAVISENEYGTGYRDGVVQKLSKKGFFWKTWEAEMMLGGVRRGAEGGAVGNIWAFTVHDPKIVDELEALTDGETVRLHYRQVWFATPWRGSTDYRVERVEHLKEGKK